jgi:GxxExxY protein
LEKIVLAFYHSIKCPSLEQITLLCDQGAHEAALRDNKNKFRNLTGYDLTNNIRSKVKRSVRLMDIEALANEVYALGAGYSERVYHNAMEVLLREKGIPYETERIVPVTFHGHVIGNLRADIIINNQLVLEFKTIKSLNDQVELQGQNYLNLTGLKTAYLINFPPFPNREVEVRRIVVEEPQAETNVT